MEVTILTASISRSGGGVSEAVRLVTTAMANHKALKIKVLTLYDEHFLADVQDWEGVEVEAYRTFGPKRFGFSPGLIVALLRSRADIVHVHGLWMFHCAAALIWSYVTGRSYIVTPHGMLERWIRSRSPIAKQIVSMLYQNRFLKRAAYFQLLTNNEVQDVLDTVGKRPFRIIPNFVELPSTSHATVPEWWQSGFEGKDVFLYFGRIHEKKGCIELCEAWNDLCARDPLFRSNSALVFCGWIDGQPKFKEQLAQLAERHRNVVYGGPQYGSAKDATLKAATFVVLPSKSEGLPVVVLEAWANRKPVLMTDACNLPIGFEQNAAIRIAETSSEEIGRELSNASRLPVPMRLEMQAAAQQIIHQHCSKAVVVGNTVQLYEETIKGTGRGAEMEQEAFGGESLP